MIKSSWRARDGTRRNRKSPNGWQTSRGGSLLACTPQEVIIVRRASERGFRNSARGTKSASRGPIDRVSALVIVPLSGSSEQVKVQMRIEQCHRGLIGRQDAGNRVLIHWVIPQRILMASAQDSSISRAPTSS